MHILWGYRRDQFIDVIPRYNVNGRNNQRAAFDLQVGGAAVGDMKFSGYPIGVRNAMLFPHLEK